MDVEAKTQPHGEAATGDDPALTALVERFAKWPDGRVHGMFDSRCKPKPMQWFVRDRLLAGRAHLLAGVGGASKTRALYHLAVGAVLGRLPWDWHIERTGSAALFLTEDTVDDSHRFMHAMGAGMSEADQAKLHKHLRVYQLAGLSARLLQLNGQALVETDVYHWLMHQIEKLPKPVAFIGIDPALGVTEGDEMSPAHQRRLGELIDRIGIESGACAMLTTHAARSSLHAEEVGSHTSRGSGAITDAVRGEFALRSMTADEARRFGIDDIVERKRYAQLIGTKGNHLAPEAYAPLWLRRGEAGLLSGVTLDQVERGTVGPREMQALQILGDAQSSGDSSMKFWRAQCAAAKVIPPGTQAAQEKAMQRIRDALVGAGLVRPGGGRGSWQPT